MQLHGKAAGGTMLKSSGQFATPGSNVMGFSSILNFARDKPLFAAWIGFALYSACASIFVQFLALPVFVPSLHAGHGLLVGQDSIVYHAIATDVATAIRQTGWSAWSLAPGGHSAAGLAAPFYYFLAPSPWSLIPINAALQATAGIIVMQLIRQLGVPLAIAFAGAVLWIGLPSSFQWTTQIQKDSYYFTGMLGVLLGWTLLLRAPTQKSATISIFRASIVLCAGLICTGIARAYGLSLVQITGTVISIVAVASLTHSIHACKVKRKYGVIAILLFVILPFVLLFAPNDDRLKAELPTPMNAVATGSYLAEITVLEKWHASTMLPHSIDRILLRLSVAREGYSGETYKNAGSMIDLEVHFSSAAQIGAYLPRALQIGLLAPFPSHWFGAGASLGGTIMRSVVGVEMMLLYPLLLFGLPLAIWRWRNLLELWLIIIFCIPVVLAYTYTTPNLGTLYRLRYGFLTMLAAVGLAAILMTLREWRLRRSY